MNTVGYHVTVPTFGVWGFQLAAASGDLPETFDIPEESTRFLTSELMEHALRFGKDAAPLAGSVNSIFEPTLYVTYLKEVNR